LGRFFAVDPLGAQYPFYSPYTFSGNQVIHMIELEGLEPVPFLSTQEPIIESLTRVSEAGIEGAKIEDVLTRVVETGQGTPKWNPKLGPVENLQQMSKMGRWAHDVIGESLEFIARFSEINKQFAEGNRPDGWHIDLVNKVIRIGEIKSATKTGIKNGLAQLARYTAQAKELYPDFAIEAELWLYRSVIPVVYTAQDGDNLSKIAEDNGTTVDELYKLNPSINKETGLIKTGQDITLYNLTYSLPNVNIQYVGGSNTQGAAFDSNEAVVLKTFNGISAVRVNILNSDPSDKNTTRCAYRSKTGKYYWSFNEAAKDKVMNRHLGTSTTVN
jgi:hypothetical protein